MTTVNTNTSTQTTGGTGSSSSSSSTATSASVSQADFLKLLTAQLQAQDPTNPMDNSQFVAQLAQFSQLQATQDLNTNLQALSTSVNNSMQTSQVINSSSLLNREVLVPATSMTLDSSDSAGGALNFSAAGTATVTISDAAGNAIRHITVTNASAGLSQFTWDGKDDSGNVVSNGSYSLSAKVTNADGSSGTADTYVAGKVSGVGFGGSSVGTYLQVAGVGGVPLSQVAQIL
ncbi:flagellar hook assembly protein FlgD [Dyella sp.]|uniref:flagellar hook assembly protein FlgD n=1 Tax=Dyella sp. TaxID=1869338 RepID=UPI002ED5019F